MPKCSKVKSKTHKILHNQSNFQKEGKIGNNKLSDDSSILYFQPNKLTSPFLILL